MNEMDELLKKESLRREMTRAEVESSKFSNRDFNPNVCPDGKVRIQHVELENDKAFYGGDGEAYRAEKDFVILALRRPVRSNIQFVVYSPALSPIDTEMAQRVLDNAMVSRERKTNLPTCVVQPLNGFEGYTFSTQLEYPNGVTALVYHEKKETSFEFIIPSILTTSSIFTQSLLKLCGGIYTPKFEGNNLVSLELNKGNTLQKPDKYQPAPRKPEPDADMTIESERGLEEATRGLPKKLKKEIFDVEEKLGRIQPTTMMKEEENG